MIIVIRSIANKSIANIRYRKSDGLIILLITYMFLLCFKFELRRLNIDLAYDFPTNLGNQSISWFPFSWINKEQIMINFNTYLYSQLDRFNQEVSLLDHFIKFSLSILPITIMAYIINSKKWIGFLIVEFLTYLALSDRFPALLGDGLLISAVIYLIIVGIGYGNKTYLNKDKFIDSIDKTKLIISYCFSVGALLLAFVYAFNISILEGEEKLVKTLEFEQEYDFYDDLIHLDVTHISLYKSDRYDQIITLNGELTVDESLYNYFGEDIDTRVYYNYKTNFYGKECNYGISHVSYTYVDAHKNEPVDRSENLMFGKFDSYIEIDNHWVKTKEDYSRKFFEFYGISGIELLIPSESAKPLLEVVEIIPGEEEYKYYDYVYKISKLKGNTLEAYLTVILTSESGQETWLKGTEPEILEENQDYVLYKARSFIDPFQEEALGQAQFLDTDQVELRIYNASMRIPLTAEQVLFSFDKDDFK